MRDKVLPKAKLELLLDKEEDILDPNLLIRAPRMIEEQLLVNNTSLVIKQTPWTSCSKSILLTSEIQN